MQISHVIKHRLTAFIYFFPFFKITNNKKLKKKQKYDFELLCVLHVIFPHSKQICKDIVEVAPPSIVRQSLRNAHQIHA